MEYLKYINCYLQHFCVPFLLFYGNAHAVNLYGLDRIDYLLRSAIVHWPPGCPCNLTASPSLPTMYFIYTVCRLQPKLTCDVLLVFIYQVAHFTLEAVDLQKLQRIMVGHTAEGHGAGWYLNVIMVKESAEATRQYVFPCHR